MPSRFLDADQARRHAEHRYDFSRKALAGRVVLLPGGAGGLGAAITALLLQDGALPVVAYRSSRGRALAFQQKLQDLYGGPVTLVEADVSKPEGRQRCLDGAFDVKGELYGLVALTGDPARVKPQELDEAVAHLYNPLHPAVIRLLALAIGTANKAKRPIAVCGEMAGEVRLTRLLLGLGLRNFSMHPAHLLTIKQRVLTTEVSATKLFVDRIKRADNPDKISALVDRINSL